MRILVTGGFGFLGSHLCEGLLEDPSVSVHVVDDLSTSPINLEDYLSRLKNKARLTWDIATVQEYFSQGPIPAFEQIYHLASPVGPAGVLPHAGKMVREIVTDTYLLIDFCLQHGASLLDVSTSEIYGGGREGYCSEDVPKIVPAATTIRLEYAIAKLAMETAITNTCRVSALRATIVRPFNIAGPRQSGRGGFVLPRFIHQAHSNEPLTVFGEGRQLRAFTHVRDMVSGIILCMAKGRSGEAYNVGNPSNKTSILDMAQRVIRIVGSKSRITFVDGKSIYGPLFEEANDKFPDSTKAASELGWAPQFDIDRTIQDAFEEYRRQLDAGIFGSAPR